MKKTCAMLALTLLVGCGEDPPPSTPLPPAPVAKKTDPAPKPTSSKPSMAPPLSASQKDSLAKDFAAARALIKQADALKAQGEQIEKTQSRAAANDTLVQAKDLYHKAIESVSEWFDGDLGTKVTDAQVKDYLSAYQSEFGKWQKSYTDIGKVHKDD